MMQLNKDELKVEFLLLRYEVSAIWGKYLNSKALTPIIILDS